MEELEWLLIGSAYSPQQGFTPYSMCPTKEISRPNLWGSTLIGLPNWGMGTQGSTFGNIGLPIFFLRRIRSSNEVEGTVGLWKLMGDIHNITTIVSSSSPWGQNAFGWAGKC